MTMPLPRTPGLLAALAEQVSTSVAADPRQESLATATAAVAEAPLHDPVPDRTRRSGSRHRIAERMKVVPPEKHTEMHRSAANEADWLDSGIRAVLGFVAGWVLLVVTSA